MVSAIAHARCGLNATGVISPVRRSFTAMLLFGFLLLRNSADAIATAARLAVDRDLELRARRVRHCG
jgi:hypothetical protein